MIDFDEIKRPTPRQLQILQLSADGDTFRAIALELGISQQTVKNHMLELRHRLGAVSSPNAVAIALRLGWIK